MLLPCHGELVARVSWVTGFSSAVLRCHFGNGGTAGDGCSGTSGLDSKPNMGGWGGVGPRTATYKAVPPSKIHVKIMNCARPGQVAWRVISQMLVTAGRFLRPVLVWWRTLAGDVSSRLIWWQIWLPMSTAAAQNVTRT